MASVASDSSTDVAQAHLKSNAVSFASGHVRALDGLRFFAFLGVFVWHALQNSASLRPWVTYGTLGVQVFFVLSGFLIGGILLEWRGRREMTLATRLKIFYIRRSLRIFPLYYLVLSILLILPFIGIPYIGGSENFFWNASYLTNFRMYFGGEFGVLSHFWSLAIEEHYYLLAPLVIFLVPMRGLAWAFVTCWIGVAIARALFALSGDENAHVLSPMQFDCMTVGMAAAMIQHRSDFLGVDYRNAITMSKLMGFLVVPVFALERSGPVALSVFAKATSQWVFAVAVGGLVLTLWNSKSFVLSRWLSMRPLPYLGKISYGLYVFHFPCLLLAYVWLSPFMAYGTAIPGLFMTLGISMLSWHFFEGPINAQRQRFSRVPSQAKTSTTAN
jgi:peptidoglycan/LPS O-acetylase OafA/YrhL